MGLLWKLATIIALIAISMSFFGIYKVINQVHESLNEREMPGEAISPNNWYLFRKFDQDFDGFLDIKEFQSVMEHTMKHLNDQGIESGVIGDDLVRRLLLNSTISNDEEYMTVKADFQPLDLTTTSKHKNEGILDNLVAVNMKGLKNWLKPFVSHANISSQDFKIFLPSFKPVVGDTWDIVTPISLKFERNLPHNRMYPPIPNNSKEQVLVKLLSLLHPRPFIQTRFVPQGTTAILRAMNDEYFDIVFRMHAEFQINEPPDLAFWFTPAQFAGRLLITRNGAHVEDFQMFVPADKKLNVDMEWITGRKKHIENVDDAWEMEVDIGYMPEMSLHGEGPTRKIGDGVPKHENIKWGMEITEWEARRTLQQRFYQFQKVLYRPFNETYKVAERQDKLVHQILLWGSLDDQSC